MAHIVDFRKPETFAEVALFLGLEPPVLEAAIAAGATPGIQAALYIRHRIPKKRSKKGGFRVVWDIADAHIRDAHRAFARRFGHFIGDVEPNFPHRSAYGYVQGRNIKDNAKKHTGNRVLLRCDLKDFFSTISKARLISRFTQLKIPALTAETLAAFATIEGKLPLGLNASPLLANLVCTALDAKLEELSSACGCTYTRYADDISISGDAVPEYGRIAEIVEGEGFRLSEGKMRVTKNGQAHFVTGLSVSDPAAPHVPRPFKRRLRQELYYCERFGIREHLKKIAAASYQRGINRIDGSVRFVASIESAIGPQLRERWRRALIAESASISYAPIHDKTGAQATFVFDEAEFKRESTNYLALCCVTTEHIDKLRFYTSALLRQHLVDPFSTGRKAKLSAKGLHFTDTPEGLRDQYIALLPYVPFRAYVAFGALGGTEEYGELYSTLLNSILPRRLMNYDRGQLTLCFEKSSRVSLVSLTRLVNVVYRDLEERNERRPIVCPITEAKSKADEPAISLPDCLLWVFSRYFESDGSESDTCHLRFERLRDKYRHIVNVDTGDVFSRRHPLEVPIAKSGEQAPQT